MRIIASHLFYSLSLTTLATFASVCHAAKEEPKNMYANTHDKTMSAMFDAREKDWRNGAVVYQVLVDRFAPPEDLEDRKHFYAAPKILRTWDEVPKRGQYR